MDPFLSCRNLWMFCWNTHFLCSIRAGHPAVRTGRLRSTGSSAPSSQWGTSVWHSPLRAAFGERGAQSPPRCHRASPESPGHSLWVQLPPSGQPASKPPAQELRHGHGEDDGPLPTSVLLTGLCRVYLTHRETRISGKS